MRARVGAGTDGKSHGIHHRLHESALVTASRRHATPSRGPALLSARPCRWMPVATGPSAKVNVPPRALFAPASRFRRQVQVRGRADEEAHEVGRRPCPTRPGMADCTPVPVDARHDEPKCET